MSEYTTNVKAGVAFLDRTFGAENWRDTVNQDYFDLLDPCGCPLGQSYDGGDYYAAVSHFDLSPEMEQAYGFRPIDDAPTSAWIELEDEWRDQLWGEDPDDY